jgi:hypothetical protein
MEEIPYNCGKIIVGDAGSKGWGVFATDDIPANTVIERCSFVAFPRVANFADAFYTFLNNQGFLSEKEKYAENLRINLKFAHPSQHYFKWSAPQPLNGEQLSYTCIVLGNGSLYNSSNAFNNCGWVVGERLFTFKTIADVKKGQELCTFYGYFLGELGQIFNCPQVFNLAIESNASSISKVYAVRFADVGEYQASQQNPTYQRLAQLLAIAKDGLRIHKLVGLAPNGDEKFGMDIPADAALSLLYSKLSEFKTNAFPLVKIIFEFETKDTNQIVHESIIFKK